MKYIRLNNQTEFFKEELPARFLGNITDINIIIGANNTRKSRFLRSIINQEHSVLIDGPEGLNEGYHASLSIFTELEAKGKETMNERLFQFQFHDTDKPSSKYKNIKEFFNTKSQLDFIDLKTSIINLNETLVAMAVPDNFNALKEIAHRTMDVTEVYLGIFAYIDQHGLPLGRDPDFRVTNVDDVRYRFETIPDSVPDYELKKEVIRKTRDYAKLLTQLTVEMFNKNLVYIPVLRSSRMIGGFTGDVYAETIQKQHFGGATSKLKIETGLLLYEKIGLARNGTRKQIRDFNAFEKFVGQAFFNSDDVHIVAHQTEKKDERNIRISLPDEREDVSIPDLGDGVQAVINLLFPVFTAEEGAWIFIDEPENHMHPGYQNLLMQVLATSPFIQAKKLRFFINTHSNHILSGALLGKTGAEIILFSRRDKDASDIQAFNGNEYHTLEKLGIFNTSVLISNCSVWVEGVTDRFYLQAFLKAYSDQLDDGKFRPVEGLHFSFIEYGGKNLVHFEFDHTYKQEADDQLKKKIEAFFINSNVFLFADSDFNAEKHDVFEAIKRPNFKYCKTSLPEIENIVPESLIQSYLTEGLKCDAAEVAACFPLDHKVKLGRHLAGKITYGKGFRKFESDGGTLRPDYKNGLADFVHKKITDGAFSWKEVPDKSALRSTIITLYDFIKAKNA
jgi:AAA15 family ATPase/GTPase